MRNFLLWLLGAGVWGYLLSYTITEWNRRRWMLIPLLAGAGALVWIALRVPML